MLYSKKKKILFMIRNLIFYIIYLLCYIINVDNIILNNSGETGFHFLK